MRRIVRSLCVVSAMFLACEVFAQEKKPVDKPTLKADVQLDLIRQQNQVYRLVLRMKDVEAQYVTMRDELAKMQVKLQADTKDALKKSNLDAEKYELNPETFEVSEKPKVQDAKIPGSQAKTPVSQ